jgi:hypothetical protein
MLAFFTTAKPFVGHNGIIQRNALKSWTLLDRDAEVILFGNEEGAAETARELGIRHEAHTEKSELGANRADYMFRRAQEISRHEIFCYSNCDIIFTEDFCRALQQAKAEGSEFLMVGRRWDTEVTSPWEFGERNWQEKVRERALRTGKRRGPEFIDYFAFSRGLFQDLPGLVVGRTFWDNWMVWNALELRVRVIDATQAVVAVHQNHDYGHHPQGKQGVYYGADADANYRLAGGWRHLRRIDDATERLTAEGVRPNGARHWAAVKRYARQMGRVGFYEVIRPVEFALLDVTRPLRNALGWRGAKVPRDTREKV